MRKPRNFKTNRCYHLISRIAHRAFFLTDDERTRFVDRMWRVAVFSGVDVLAYCFMSNHFHILVYVPKQAELSDAALFERIGALYSGERLEELRKEWDVLVKAGNAKRLQEFRRRFLSRMGNVSELMKTLKQNSTMSYNGRRVHTGTMWESRFRVREYGSDEKAALMNVAGYIDRNPVKAKVVGWPDKYDWCSFSAACKGDRRCVDGYRFIYSFAPLSWDRIREIHEKSIHLVLKELEDEGLAGKAKIGLSVDEEKREKSRRRVYSEAELSLPEQVPHLLERGSDKVAFDLLKLLLEGERRPAELRAALGIASVNFFTSRYLTPLAKAGLIEIAGKCSPCSPSKTFKLTRRGRTVANA